MTMGLTLDQWLLALNTMMCDPTGVIHTLNEASRTTLKGLEQYLPIEVDDIVGSSFDVFHKKPEHQRSLVADPNNFPYSAIIEIGPEKLQLNACAVSGTNGEYLGAMVNWEVVTTKVELVSALKSYGPRRCFFKP